MVIGNGMIAKRFAAYSANDDVIIFASGVSDSGNADAENFRREAALLSTTIQKNPGKRLVYFSTCSIYDPSMQGTPYVSHKLDMEAAIKAEAKRHFIFRVSNPIGHTQNRHTVLNFFVDHILSGQAFQVWSYASRNLIDLDDMFLVCDALLRHANDDEQIINIANPVNYPVTHIVQSIEEHFGRKGNYTVVHKGNSPLIDTTAIQPVFDVLNLEFSGDYLRGLLQKYYPA